jgi:hypothetical protein
MKYHTVRSICWRLLVTCLLMSLAFACSTLPPPIKVNDIRSIRGKWQGSATHAQIGLLRIRLTVRENGQWEMITDPDFLSYGNRFSGTARVEEGKIRFNTETPKLSGTCTLHRWQDKRLLIFISDDGETRVDFQP